jgi:membrane protease YdiL (CAAX protease family)
METTQLNTKHLGWLRALIYAIGAFLIVIIFSKFGPVISKEVADLTGNGEDSIIGVGILYTIMGIVVVLFTGLMRKFVDKKSFESLGFTWKGHNNEAALGLFAALAILGIGSLLLVATGNISFVSANFDASPLMLELGIMVVVAFVEEVIFRGYLLNNLMQSMNKWMALIITSVLFALFHCSNPDITVFAIINILLAGILIGINYIFTKNLWFGICFHFAWNFFQGPILGYDVSGLKLSSLLQQTITGPEFLTGGQFGFEGSLLCPLLFALFIIIFSFAFSKRYQQKLP